MARVLVLRWRRYRCFLWGLAIGWLQRESRRLQNASASRCPDRSSRLHSDRNVLFRCVGAHCDRRDRGRRWGPGATPAGQMRQHRVRPGRGAVAAGSSARAHRPTPSLLATLGLARRVVLHCRHDGEGRGTNQGGHCLRVYHGNVASGVRAPDRRLVAQPVRPAPFQIGSSAPAPRPD